MESRIYRELYESYYNIYTLDEGRADKLLPKPIQRSDARTERSGGDEPARILNHFLSRGVKKAKGVKEEQEIIIDYLLDEGYTDSVEGAMIIMESMSDQWYNIIVEGRDTNKDKNVSELSSDLASLRKRQKDLTARVIKDPSDTKAQNALKQIVQQIKNASGARSQLAGIQGVTSNTISAPKPKRSSEEDEMTPEEKREYRAGMRSTRSAEPTGTPEERKKRREAIASRRSSTAGRTPQSSKMNLPEPGGRETKEQRRRGQLGDVMSSRAGGSQQATTYVTPEGERRQLGSLGATEINYGGRGRGRIGATYQAASSGSGTKSPTPAGSTVDPSRRRLRGTGRSTG